MKPNRSKRSSGGGGSSVSPITASNYVERATAFIRAKDLPQNDDGSHPGGYVARADTAQWSAWMKYFAFKGVPTRFVREIGSTTVPAEWPYEFDPAGWADFDLAED